MRTLLLPLICFVCFSHSPAQDVMTPERLWQLGRLGAVGLTADGQQVIYRVTTPDIEQNTSRTITYALPVAGGTPREIATTEGLIRDKHLSPDGKYRISVREVKIHKVFGKDYYPD